MAIVETEEHYDILDEHGDKTGDVLPKSVVHENELRHGSVFIWIYNNEGEALLQLRSKDKKCFPGVWDVSVAGHISAGDTPLETAIREIEEEIGVKVQTKELKQVAFITDVVPLLSGKTHPECCWVYILHRELDPKELAIQKGELSEVRLQAIRDIQAQRQLPNSDTVFAARNPHIYDTAFQEIESILA